MCHFVQEVTELWYPVRAIINLLKYHIVLASFTKWSNSKQLKVSV